MSVKQTIMVTVDLWVCSGDKWVAFRRCLCHMFLYQRLSPAAGPLEQSDCGFFNPCVPTGSIHKTTLLCVALFTLEKTLSYTHKTALVAERLPCRAATQRSRVR